jgi:hypothetical protein
MTNGRRVCLGLGAILTLLPAGPARGQALLGGEFQVNSYTTSYQSYPAVAIDLAGGFVVVWRSAGQDGDGTGIFGRRFDAAGTPQGAEFQVNSYTTGSQTTSAAVASDPAGGGFVVVWPGSGGDISGQRFDAAGAPQGGEFRVNSYTTAGQSHPGVAVGPTGDFVVVWQSYGDQDGNGGGIFGQRFDAAGEPLGGEFQVNSLTNQAQRWPSVATDPAGGFVVAWLSAGGDGSGYGVTGRRFDAAGAAEGPEFQVNSYTTSNQWFPSVAAGATRTFVVVWQSHGRDGGNTGIAGRRFAPEPASVDGFEPSDLSPFPHRARAPFGLRFFVNAPPAASTASRFPLVVELYDVATGLRLTTSGVSITLQALRCPGYPAPCSVVIVNDNFATSSTVGGVASFINVRLATSNDDYYFAATAGGYNSGTSSVFDVAPATMRFGSIPAPPISTPSRFGIVASIHRGNLPGDPIDTLADGIPAVLELLACPG